jgi:opacity protein-like surface antigen
MNHKIKQLSLITAFLIAILVTNNVQAQDFRLGFKGNPLFSTISPNTDNFNSVATKVGFSYGLMFDYFIKDNYAISSEFGISSLGGKVEYNRNDTTVNSNLSIRYIDIPVTIKLLTNELNNNLKVYGKFGLGLSFRIKSEVENDYKKGQTNFSNDDIKNANDFIQPLNTSLVIGAGVEYNLAENLDLVVGLTYNNGFSNIMKSRSMYKLLDQATGLAAVKAYDANLSFITLNIGLLF